MKQFKKDEHGFGAIEGILVVLIIVAIGIIGYYVDKHKTNTSSPIVTTTTPSSPAATSGVDTPLSSGTSNTALQSDLNNVNASTNQTNQDLSASNSALNDQSTLTTVPN